MEDAPGTLGDATRSLLGRMRRAGPSARLQTWAVPSGGMPRLWVLATLHPLAAMKCHSCIWHNWSEKQRKAVAVHGKVGKYRSGLGCLQGRSQTSQVIAQCSRVAQLTSCPGFPIS